MRYCLLTELPAVVIEGYTHNSTLKTGSSVPLGTQLILVCQIVGLPHGAPLSYTWTCPNGQCAVEGYCGRNIYSEHILAVNTTFTSDGGTYACQVTATGGQQANGRFTLTITGMCSIRAEITENRWHFVFRHTLNYSGGRVVHSYGRLIPHEFPITDLQQISGPDGIGRITCTVSSGEARFVENGGQLETGGVTQTRNGTTATLVVNPTDYDSFQNKQLFCTKINTNFFSLAVLSTS